MQPVSTICHLDMVKRDNKVKVRLGFLHDPSYLVRIHLGEVQPLELAKGSAWRAAYNPSRFLLVDIPQRLHPIRLL